MNVRMLISWFVRIRFTWYGPGDGPQFPFAVPCPAIANLVAKKFTEDMKNKQERGT